MIRHPTPKRLATHLYGCHMKAFAPLECNPDVFNAFLQKLGTKDLQFVDVYGLDPDLLAFIPRPVRAILLVFPVSSTYETFRQKADQAHNFDESQAYWSKQTIANSCGTMALIHALANGVETYQLGTSLGKDLITQFQATSQPQRPKFLESSSVLETLHDSLAGEGSSAPISASDPVDHHYVCLTKHGDDLVELDGRRKGPIVLKSNVANADILADETTLATMAEFIHREANSANFAMLALVDQN